MLVKWIRCQVEDHQKQGFSFAQEGWKPLRDINGFITQFGGWNLENNNEACILAFWKDYASYQQFMKEHHDRIYNQIDQKDTYQSIDVELYNTINADTIILEDYCSIFLSPNNFREFNLEQAILANNSKKSIAILLSNQVESISSLMSDSVIQIKLEKSWSI